MARTRRAYLAASASRSRLHSSGSPSLDRRARIALVYHRVGDRRAISARAPARARTASSLRAQVRHLASRYRVVPASGSLDGCPRTSPGDRFPSRSPSTTISVPMWTSARRSSRGGATATFFLTGASLDGPHRFWWERLQEAFDRRLDLDPLGFGARGQRHPRGRPDDRGCRLRSGSTTRRSPRLVGPDPGSPGLRADRRRGGSPPDSRSASTRATTRCPGSPRRGVARDARGPRGAREAIGAR